MAHTTESLIVTCMDFRFQKYINAWADKTVGIGNFDRVAWAGGVFDMFGIFKHVELAKRLHHIKQVILINHEDCGAYGAAGTHARHVADLQQTAKSITALLPELKVQTYFLHLDGTFEQV